MSAAVIQEPLSVLSTAEPELRITEGTSIFMFERSAKVGTVSRLGQYGKQTARPASVRISAIAGMDVKITAVRITQGEYGELAFFDVMTSDSEKVVVMSGDPGVIAALKEALAQKAIPCVARFTQQGRSWLIE